MGNTRFFWGLILSLHAPISLPRPSSISSGSRRTCLGRGVWLGPPSRSRRRSVRAPVRFQTWSVNSGPHFRRHLQPPRARETPTSPIDLPTPRHLSRFVFLRTRSRARALPVPLPACRSSHHQNRFVFLAEFGGICHRPRIASTRRTVKGTAWTRSSRFTAAPGSHPPKSG